MRSRRACANPAFFALASNIGPPFATSARITILIRRPLACRRCSEILEQSRISLHRARDHRLEEPITLRRREIAIAELTAHVHNRLPFGGLGEYPSSSSSSSSRAIAGVFAFVIDLAPGQLCGRRGAPPLLPI